MHEIPHKWFFFFFNYTSARPTNHTFPCRESNSTSAILRNSDSCGLHSFTRTQNMGLRFEARNVTQLFFFFFAICKARKSHVESPIRYAFPHKQIFLFVRIFPECDKGWFPNFVIPEVMWECMCSCCVHENCVVLIYLEIYVCKFTWKLV